MASAPLRGAKPGNAPCCDPSGRLPGRLCDHNSIIESLTKHLETMGGIDRWIDMFTDIFSGLQLGQPIPEITFFLQNPFERLPCSTCDRVGVSVAGPARNIRRYVGVSLAHCLPVAEIPGLQLFNRNPGNNLPIGAAAGLPGPKMGLYAHLLKSGLEFVAVVAVAIHDHKDAAPGWHPVRVTPEAVLQFSQKSGLALIRVNPE